jgi:hypothetical protein
VPDLVYDFPEFLRSQLRCKMPQSGIEKGSAPLWNKASFSVMIAFACWCAAV